MQAIEHPPETTATETIRVVGLRKRYGEREAVGGISFSVREGELFGFLGPNGAGKTTTINMLCTLLRPDAGGATVDGHDIVREAEAVRRAIGLVFQQQAVDDYLTVEQNMHLMAYAYGLGGRAREERIRDLLTLVGLWERRHDMVHTLSGGLKRRLEIVRGMVHGPRVLFLDEPTLGVDPQSRRLIWERILELRRRERVTVFLTTHYMDEAERCDRVAIVDRGAIATLDTPAALEDALDGDVVSLQAEDTVAAVGAIGERYGLAASVHDGRVRFTVPRGEAFLPEFVRGFPVPLTAIGVRRPTLDDVFLDRTGHTL
jgi:ABC-2 type transport system ATP-binding protein